MDHSDIRIYASEVETVMGEKEPPFTDSDVWYCKILTPSRILHIYLHNRAKYAVLQHAYSMPKREIGGGLIGGIYTYTDHGTPRLYVEIIDAIEGNFTSGNATSLTFTPDTWSQMAAEVAERFPQHRIVGWYHTHPNHGVFLSGDDCFIQDNFFQYEGQVALVVDHIRELAGFFTGHSNHPHGIQRSDSFTWDAQLYKQIPGSTQAVALHPVTRAEQPRQSTVEPPRPAKQRAKPPRRTGEKSLLTRITSKDLISQKGAKQVHVTSSPGASNPAAGYGSGEQPSYKPQRTSFAPAVAQMIVKLVVALVVGIGCIFLLAQLPHFMRAWLPGIPWLLSPLPILLLLILLLLVVVLLVRDIVSPE
jgi:proteasome lid subunit RPN8/RPN11